MYTVRRVIAAKNFTTEKIDHPIPGGGHCRGSRSVRLPDTQEEIVIEVDIDAIARCMGQRAVDNASGKSVDGHVTVRHVRKKGKQK